MFVAIDKSTERQKNEINARSNISLDPPPPENLTFGPQNLHF